MTGKQPLDPDSERLVNELLTRAGMIMEDASVIALVGDSTSENLGQRVEALERSAASISALVRAARVMHDA